MKKIFIFVLLILVTSFVDAGNIIKSNDSDKAYRTAKRELLELGFDVGYVNKKSTLLERKIGSWFYQVVITIKSRKKIDVDIYAFIDGNFKKSWSNPSSVNSVLRDINVAIEYRIKNGDRIPHFLLYNSMLWSIHRDFNITDMEGVRHE